MWLMNSLLINSDVVNDIYALICASDMAHSSHTYRWTRLFIVPLILSWFLSHSGTAKHTWHTRGSEGRKIRSSKPASGHNKFKGILGYMTKTKPPKPRLFSAVKGLGECGSGSPVATRYVSSGSLTYVPALSICFIASPHNFTLLSHVIKIT